MNKNTQNKINKILEKNNVKLKYCTATNNVFVNDSKTIRSALKTLPFFGAIKKSLKIDKNDDILMLIVEYAMLDQFDSTEDKKKKEEQKKQAEEKKQHDIKERLNEKNMEDWETKMLRDKDGFIDRTQKRNMYFYFKFNPIFNDRFKFNDFSKIETYNKELIEPHIVTALSMKSEEYMQNANESWVQSVTNLVCHENVYNPIVTGLNMLPLWDGKERVETYLIDYIGAHDTKLVRSMTKKFFYAMFERLFHPGCRFDHMLITYDNTKGTGKTSIFIVLLEALMTLAGNTIEDSGIVSLNDLGFDQDVVQCLNKAWLAYVDELAKFLKEEPEDVKKFITLTVDNARLSYARLNKNFPRHCVLYGSTNTNEFIKDTSDSYERRFWIVDCEGTRHEDESYWEKSLPFETKLQVLSEAYYFWKENPDYKYNELEEDEIEELKKVQDSHTMASKDTILAQKLEIILDFDYNYPDDFKNYYDWRNEAVAYWTNYKIGYSSNGVLISEETQKMTQKNAEKPQKNSEKTQKNNVFLSRKLTKIPIVWVKWFIQEELGRVINDDNYVNKLIKHKWSKNKNAYYNDIRGIFERIL